MRHVIELGKIDYNKSGRRNCPATLELNLEGTSDGWKFSACAFVWNPRRTDIYMGGQCLEEVCSYFPHDKRAQRVLAIWRDWHFNYMKAGSPAQEAFLKANQVKVVYPENHYDKACAALEAAGLQPDPNYQHNGKPYRYGSAWLKATIPADVVAEIQSLMAT